VVERTRGVLITLKRRIREAEDELRETELKRKNVVDAKQEQLPQATRIQNPAIPIQSGPATSTVTADDRPTEVPGIYVQTFKPQDQTSPSPASRAVVHGVSRDTANTDIATAINVTDSNLSSVEEKVESQQAGLSLVL